MSTPPAITRPPLAGDELSTRPLVIMETPLNIPPPKTEAVARLHPASPVTSERRLIIGVRSQRPRPR